MKNKNELKYLQRQGATCESCDKYFQCIIPDENGMVQMDEAKMCKEYEVKK